MSLNDKTIDISVIVPVTGRNTAAEELYAEYKTGLDALDQSYELIFVLDGPHEVFARGLQELVAEGHHMTVIGMTRTFGEATAIMAAFEHAAGKVILTLPAHHQIAASDIGKLVNALDSCDLAMACRSPRTGNAFERLRRSVFHGLLATVTGLHFKDLGCGARAMKRRVLEEIQLYGEQHRFLAVLADRRGFRVREVDVRQSPRDRFLGFYEPRVYFRGLLDIFSIFFLVRFTKRPFRFFGMLGAGMALVGGAILAWIVVERLFFGAALTERPAMLLAALVVVLGFQLFALGLLGELVIFTHARAIKDYQIERVIQFRQRAPHEVD